jgi:putative membrane protein
MPSPLVAEAAAWQPSPLVLAAALVALALYGRAFLRLRRRRRCGGARYWRLAAFAAAVLLGALALVSPLDGLAEELVSAHMLQHVLIADLVPALALLSLRGPLLYLVPPRRLARLVVRLAPLREGIGLLSRPLPALCAWATAIAAWHTPAAYEAAVATPLLHELEHLSLLVGGLLVWWQLLDPARRGALSPLARLGYAVALLAAGGALVNVLVFSGPLYPSYAQRATRPLGLSATADQELAGLVMLVEQWLTVGVFLAFLLARHPRALLFPGRAEARPGERHPFAV